MTPEFFAQLPLERILRPTLLLDEQTARRNIARMAVLARRSGILFRPHFKTHRSAEVAGWFRDEGVTAITVSSLLMARYFARAGWKDITVAFPVNLRETGLINELAGEITLNLLVEHPDTVQALEKELTRPAGVFIEIDTGYGRSGIAWDHTVRLDETTEALRKCKKLRFKGFLSHTGNTYAANGRQEILHLHHQALQRMQEVQERYRTVFPESILSMGDTPAFSLLDKAGNIGEMRPGNFVFYDLMQYRLGACAAEDIAVAMACPVVACYPERNELILYGGAVHFSKEYLPEGSGKNFGQVIDPQQATLVPESYLTALSQEHGTVHMPAAQLRKYRHGDLLFLAPVHSCLTANLMGSYLTAEGKILKTMEQNDER
jgi:D-serine deaminase-like pyridoxal phosphate-dependent protein